MNGKSANEGPSPETRSELANELRPTPLGHAHAHYRPEERRWVISRAGRDGEPRRTPLGAVHFSIRPEAAEDQEDQGDQDEGGAARDGGAEPARPSGRRLVKWAVLAAVVAGAAAATLWL